MTQEQRAEKIEAYLKAQEGTIPRMARELAALLEPEAGALRELIHTARSGKWGRVKAWIVEGAPDKKTGIEAAKELTHINCLADSLLASYPDTPKGKEDEFSDDEIGEYVDYDSKPDRRTGGT